MAISSEEMLPLSRALHDRASAHGEQRQKLQEEMGRTPDVWNSDEHERYQDYAQILTADGKKDETLLQAVAETLPLGGYLDEYDANVKEVAGIMQELAELFRSDALLSTDLEDQIRMAEMAKMAELMQERSAYTSSMKQVALHTAVSLLIDDLNTHKRSRPPDRQRW